jgi:Helix-turn-helix domain/AraC-type transcriptional regulator N-terminus
MLALLDAPGDAGALAAGIEREILWRLVTGPQGATVRQIGLGRRPARPPGPRDPLDPRPLRRDAARRGARRAGDDERLLTAPPLPRATSMTPIQFQKQIRPHEARARLLTEPGDVAGVGFAVGYDSPSQFSREYRRLFGVPPSRDAVALCEAAVLPST